MNNYCDLLLQQINKRLKINEEKSIPRISIIRNELDQKMPNERVLFDPNEIES